MIVKTKRKRTRKGKKRKEEGKKKKYTVVKSKKNRAFSTRAFSPVFLFWAPSQKSRAHSKI